MTSQFQLVIAKKYAKAFLNSFKDKINLSDIENIEKFVHFLNQNKKALFYIELTFLEENVRKEAFFKFFEKFNINSNFEKLVDLLIRDKRIFLILDILNFVIEIYRDQSNIEEFVIASSEELDQNELDNILNFLKDKTGKKIIYKTLIDKSLIAGIKLYSDTLSLEISINKQLKALSRVY